nr:EOG090X02BW [Artemia franciscana]
MYGAVNHNGRMPWLLLVDDTMATAPNGTIKVRQVPSKGNVIKLAVTFDKFLLDKIKSMTDLDGAKKNEAAVGTLVDFDQTETLSVILSRILSAYRLQDEGYDLYLTTNTRKYVTSENRSDLSDGDFVMITTSVKKLVDDIMQKLGQSTNERNETLKKLNLHLKDATVAREFVRKEGHKVLTNLIESSKLDSCVTVYILQSIIQLMDHNILSWEFVEAAFVNKVTGYVNSNVSDAQLLQHSLSILEALLGTSKAHYVERGVTIPNLASKVQSKTNDPKVHLNTISLINALFLRADEKQRTAIVPTISTRNIRNLIAVNIIRDGLNIGSEMLHQLYILQTLCLSTLAEKKNAMLCPQDPEVLDKIRELRAIAFEVEYGMTDTIRQHSLTREYRKLGFNNDVNPACELQNPPGKLALDCMCYFARNHTDRYRKFIFENSKGSDRDCPFGSTGIELTRLLCDILQIGEPLQEQGGTFYPMFLGSDSPFFEMFSICIQAVNKTWKEMHATTADISKVFQIVREQVIRTLVKEEEVRSFDTFRSELQRLSYNEINNLLQQERQLKEESGSNSKQILQLREMLAPELLELVQQQRIGYLVRGTRFTKYVRGQRLKDKFWFIRLSPSHKVFHYGDCDDKTIPSLEELKNKVPVMEIKDVLIGKDCPHVKDIKSKKMTHPYVFSMVLDTPEPSTLDFVAPDEQTYEYWLDGINALLGRLDAHSSSWLIDP